MRVLSVDLGTSNTVAVLSAHGRPPRVVEVDGSSTMPSAVYCEEDGTLVVGRDAERRARLDPARFEPNPKRRVDEGMLLLGETVVPVTDALAAVLRRVLEETVRQLGGASPDQVRLTHPAQWGPMRCNVLLSAARLAGMGPELVLVPEPVAAAAHFASFHDQTLAPGQALAVYDLGAGTFDVAVVGATPSGFAVLAEAGLPDLGGLDVDQALLENVGRQVSVRDPGRWQNLLRPESTADRRARRALQEDVRSAKEALSRHPQTEVPMPEPFDDVLVTRAELEALVRPSMLRSVELLASTIRSTGAAPEQLVGIYLVGGASRIPLVATMIAEQVRVVPVSLDQPETAVALGAHHVADDTSTGQHEQQSVTGPISGPTPTLSFPNSGGFPAQTQSYPVSGPNPVVGHPSGPYQTGPQQQFNFPSVTQPVAVGGSGGGPNRKVLLAVGAVVVLVLAVVGTLFALSGDGVPSAEECKSDGNVDDQGFTACLRQFAGAVPDGGTCKAGASAGVSGISAIKGKVVSCGVADGYTVQYVLTETVTGAQQGADAVVKSLKVDTVEARWSGNGLEGVYRAAADNGLGLLTFTAKDRPLLGILTRSDADRDMTADTVADFFERSVQPGT
ncbi:Hsp70 family protein [Umezawaea beigongshangensis]|uniref:Hsp70 family protein n=1 Tax=Umezawaea beigongshangensis TaxID=2780383 RepID=UPI0018F1F245|nr:Hsp70 family protein [Umezawaea beigongshangensis]